MTSSPRRPSVELPRRLRSAGCGRSRSSRRRRRRRRRRSAPATATTASPASRAAISRRWRALSEPGDRALLAGAAAARAPSVGAGRSLGRAGAALGGGSRSCASSFAASGWLGVGAQVAGDVGAGDRVGLPEQVVGEADLAVGILAGDLAQRALARTRTSSTLDARAGRRGPRSPAALQQQPQHHLSAPRSGPRPDSLRDSPPQVCRLPSRWPTIARESPRHFDELIGTEWLDDDPDARPGPDRRCATSCASRSGSSTAA